MARGYLSDDTLGFIGTEVTKDDKPVIMAFHHPSIEPGGWLNRKLLENRMIFNAFISNYSNIRLILCDHTHYSCQHQIGHSETWVKKTPKPVYLFPLYGISNKKSMVKRQFRAKQQIQAFLTGKLSEEQEQKLKKLILRNPSYRKIALMKVSLYKLSQHHYLQTN